MEKFEERLAKDQKGMVRYIHIVLLISFVCGAVINYFVESLFCAFAFGIGTFFLILCIVNIVNSHRYRKESVELYATVVACEKIKAQSEEASDYYKITYELYHAGEQVLLELPSYDRIREGKTLKVFYIPDKAVLRTEEDMKDIQSSTGLKIIVASCYVAALVSGILVTQKREWFTEEFMMILMLWLVAVVFTLVGVGALCGYIRQKREVSNYKKTQDNSNLTVGIIFSLLGIGLILVGIFAPI